MIATGGVRYLLREIQGILFLAVEAGWLFAWSAALGSWLPTDQPSPVLGAAAVVGLLILAALATRAVYPLVPSKRIAGLTVALLGVAAAAFVGASTLLIVRPSSDWSATWRLFSNTNVGLRDGAAMVLALLAWWRGIAAGRARLSLDEVEAALRGAIVGLAVVFVLCALASAGLAAEASMVESVLVVLFAGLIGMPLARIRDLSQASRRQGGPPLGVRGHWLTIFLATVATLLLFTLLLADVLTFERIDTVFRTIAGPIDAVLTIVVYAIAIPVGLLIQGVVYLLQMLLHGRQQPRPLQPPETNWLQALRDQARPGAAPPEALVLILKWTIGAAVVALVVWLLARAVFRFAEGTSSDDVEETRDFVWSWAAVRDEILRLIRDWLGRRRSQPAVAPSRQQHASRIDDQAWGPRELYRELLRLGARRGRARRAAETPREYERALAGVPVFRERPRDVEVLTETYSRARYGDEPPDSRMVAEAQQALNRLKERDDTAAESPEPHGGERWRRVDEGMIRLPDEE